MTGVSLSTLQASGVTTTFASITDIRWQPHLYADVQVGFFLDEATFLAGGAPVHRQYVALDITLIDPTGNIPLQIFTQLTAPGALLDGGTLV